MAENGLSAGGPPGLSGGGAAAEKAARFAQYLLIALGVGFAWGVYAGWKIRGDRPLPGSGQPYTLPYGSPGSLYGPAQYEPALTPQPVAAPPERAPQPERTPNYGDDPNAGMIGYEPEGHVL